MSDIDAARLIAGLARIVRDIGIAEELDEKHHELGRSLEALQSQSASNLDAVLKNTAKAERLFAERAGRIQSVPARGRTTHGLVAPMEIQASRANARTSEPAPQNYQLLPSARGDLLAKLGRFDGARNEFERALLLQPEAK